MSVLNAIAVAALLIVIAECVYLAAQRRLFLSDRQRRHLFVGFMSNQLTMPPPNGKPIAPPCLTAAAAKPDEGVLYVDAEGHCTFADDTARALFPAANGEMQLAELLAGGAPEAGRMLDVLRRTGVVAQHVTTLTTANPRHVQLSGVAFRDREDHLWGAALFIRPTAAAVTESEPAVSPSPL